MVQFTLYVERDTIIHRFDPRAKLVWLGCFFVWSVTFNHPLWCLMVFSIAFTAAVTSRTISQFKYALPGMISLFIMCCIMWPFFRSGYTPLRYIGPLLLFYESVLYGLGSAIRIVAMILAGLVFFATTRVEDLFVALLKLKRSPLFYGMVFGVSIIFRFIPTFFAEAKLIMSAQEARGVDVLHVNLIEKIKNSIPMMSPLFVTTLRRAGELGLAVDSRAFRAKVERTFLYTVKMTAKDYVIAILSLALTALFLYLRIRGYGAILPVV